MDEANQHKHRVLSLRDRRGTLQGRQVTLMGLGRHGGGVAAARFLVESGAELTVTDTADRDSLAESLDRLADLPLKRLRLGGHDESDFRAADLLVVNPAVRPENRFVQLARQSATVITSEIELFLDRCPGKIVGVSGTNGKSTTAAMIAAILQENGLHTLLGGNIEQSLLPQLESITAQTWCVLELSSFQLHWLSESARRPDIAVITNCQQNHLDWHGSLEAYREAKLRILGRDEQQGPLHEQSTSSSESRPRLVDPHGIVSTPTHDLQDTIGDLPPLLVPGLHNQQNAAVAAIAGELIGCRQQAIQGGLARFGGLPHRLERVGQVAGRGFINDSQATTPGSTIAALETLGPAVWLLAGGSDKGADLTELASVIARQSRGAGFFGELGPQLHDLVLKQNPHFSAHLCDRLIEAFNWCVRQSHPGETILLSPACASLDQYRDYAARGADFRHRVDSLRANDCGKNNAAANRLANTI